MSKIAPTSAEALLYFEDIATDAMSRCGVPAKDAREQAARIRRALAARFGGRTMYITATPRRASQTGKIAEEVIPFLKAAVCGVLTELGINAKAKDRILDAEVAKLVDHFRGVPIYISMDKAARRSERIAAVRSQFNGHNHSELAERHGVCLQTIYRDLSADRIEAAPQPRRKRAI